MEKDYYKILGITDEEKKLKGKEFEDVLKKKYRKLSIELHPDKHVNDTKEEQEAAAEKFKEVNEANTVLSNAQARERYDNGGMDGMDIDEFMSHFANMGGFFGGMGGFFGGMDMTPKIPRTRASVHVTFEEAVTGCVKKLKANISVCPNCKGSGRFVKTSRQGNRIFSETSACPNCGGSGLVHGEEREFNIEIPAGACDGLTFESDHGDIIIIVTVVVGQNEYFQRVDKFSAGDQLNVVHYEKVPMKECLLGFKRTCKTIDGGQVYIDAKECTHDGQSFIFNGLGFPSPNNPNIKGDYAVVIVYEYPEKLSEKQKEALKDF